ncbi:molybdopterin cofactor-binding domain-containing protein [Streptomyces purpurogeneiscleroticus]|uniref:molybdopterin cofactor-binding domain-containing protein n=1 Tax=Streptomyces purpurogeneiscleroticus TaxID=68259 RepID=UPI001CBB6E22|nr:molybdopterin cofactor-binding domain-containing protein [Streptomyces purpurogeneiscleroticus]MBZ4017173.1 isoquinoline 1-oxidoreductase [Streptomyces purpurogeneiscleroticus]
MTDVPARGGRTTGDAERAPIGRRAFIGYVLAGATLAVAADLRLGTPAHAAVPSAPQIPELYDLEDLQTDAARPTSALIKIVLNEDGTASFELPRMEVGQGITTSTAMIIAEELDLPVDKVHVTLAPARPELVFNQLTGGSNSTVSTFTPVRVAAAIARESLLEAAAIELGSAVALLKSKGGVIYAPDGSSLSYGSLATKAASRTVKAVEAELKPASSFAVIGKPHGRDDARLAVTGQKKFAMDLQVPDALPTMVCRPPTLNGSPESVRNRVTVLAMPGVTDVAMVDTGVAVRAKTFGQCIDAVRALDVDWAPGPVEGESDETILARLRKAELPLAVPKIPALAETVEADFTFMFRSSAALEPNCAIADVRSDRATVWAGLKSPIVAQGDIAKSLGLPQSAVTVNVITGGGSFGHKLFGDAAIEAAKISKAMGKPVKLMWHRADEPRQGRVHPMATSRIRAAYLAGEVLTFEQRHTSIVTDFAHGLGEMITSTADKLPTGLGGLGFSETIFTLTQELPYNFGVVTQLLSETDARFNTGSMRNIYSPDVACANELVIDQLARKMGRDPLAFRLAFLKNDRVKAALRKVADVGRWGRPMPAGMAQGIAVHSEYKGATAVLVEIDCRPETVNRKIHNAVTGPRVTKAVIAVDAGLVVNPEGLEAQMLGGVSDGIALALTSSLHLRDGHFLEASWDNYFYTRQWNVPLDFECVVMPSDSEQPGGAGEAGVAASVAAVACAYARATGTVPTRFPINHDTLSFEVKPFIPPVPESPSDGLSHTY